MPFPLPGYPARLDDTSPPAASGFASVLHIAQVVQTAFATSGAAIVPPVGVKAKRSGLGLTATPVTRRR